MSQWRDFLTNKAVNTSNEIGAYEFLWKQHNTSTKRMAELFHANPRLLPSELVAESDAAQAAEEVLAHFAAKGIKRFGVRIHGTHDYPEQLRDAIEPIELLYFLGSWELAEAPRRVAVVGTRKVSADGAARTKKLVKALVDHDFTVVSGLAQGVDTIAHETAIKKGRSHHGGNRNTYLRGLS